MQVNKDRKSLQKHTSFSEEELDYIFEEVLVDSYGFDEELSSWAVYLEDKLIFPFFVKVMGKRVQAIAIKQE